MSQRSAIRPRRLSSSRAGSRRRRAHLSAIALAALVFLAQTASALTVSDVAKDLICQCGCNLVLAVCEMTGWAVPAKELIKEKIEQGQTREEIVAYFVEEYGEKILAAPTKRGFNLTAWVLPFAAIGGAGYGILRVLRAWVALRSREEGPGAYAELEEHDPALDAMLTQLQADLQHLDE